MILFVLHRRHLIICIVYFNNSLSMEYIKTEMIAKIERIYHIIAIVMIINKYIVIIINYQFYILYFIFYL
jgi:hypothetical protein